MTKREHPDKSSSSVDEPEEKDVVRRGPISDPDREDKKTTEETDDPNRFDAG